MKSQILKKSSKKNSTKKNNYISKIEIPVNFNKKDGGFEDMRNPRLLSFLMRNIKKGNNLIQTQPSKPFYCDKETTLYLQAVPIQKWNLDPTWKGVKCHRINDFLKSYPCKLGSGSKRLFVKLKSNPYLGGFGLYLLSINLGLIDEKKHLKFIKTLKDTFQDKPIKIHNEDVTWFHLREDK